MKVGAIIQARVSSRRLPGKVLKELPYNSGITVLSQVIRRLKRCKTLNDIIVAMTTEKEDDELVRIVQGEGVKYFRGSKEDVLSRFYGACRENGLEIVVRVTSDCPCIDSGIVDFVVERHLSTNTDFTSNILMRAFPHGMDVEVMSFETLEKAHLGARQTFEREHVCPYIYKSHPQRFKISSVEAPERLSAPEIRVTLDTEEDYTLLCAVFDYLYTKNEFFGVEEIIQLFCDKPWLKNINGKVIHKKVFDSPQQEIEEAVRVLDLQELNGAKRLLMNHLK